MYTVLQFSVLGIILMMVRSKGNKWECGYCALVTQSRESSAVQKRTGILWQKETSDLKDWSYRKEKWKTEM